ISDKLKEDIIKLINSFKKDSEEEEEELVMQVITIEDVKIEVERKKVKNFNLTVKAPNGKVKLTYPYHASEQDYQKFLYSKINWIKQKQNKYKNFKVPTQ